MANVALTLIRRKLVEQFTDGMPQRLASAGLGAAQHSLELGKHLFTGVKVRAVRGQVTQRSARRFDGWLDFGDFVRTEVVHHYDIARAQRGYQKLLGPGYKCLAVDWPVQHQGCQQAIGTERADKRRGVPVPDRRIAQAPLALGRAAPGGCHVGRGPRLVQKGQPRSG